MVATVSLSSVTFKHCLTFEMPRKLFAGEKYSKTERSSQYIILFEGLKATLLRK